MMTNPSTWRLASLFAFLLLSGVVILMTPTQARAEQTDFVMMESLPDTETGLLFKGFLALGMDFRPTGSNPSTDFSVREVELEIDWTIASLMRMEVALQYVQGPAGIALIDLIVQRAAVRFTLPAGFFFLGGRYFSYQGWESPNNSERLQVTGSFVANLTPNTLTGAALGWGTTLGITTLEFQIYASNRFDTNGNGVLQPSTGLYASLGLKLPPGSSLLLNGSINYGVEPSATSPVRGQLPVLNVSVYLLAKFFQERWWLLPDFFVVSDPSTGDTWWALSITTHVVATPFLAFTLRYSMVEDPQQLREPTGSTLNEFSAAVRLKPLMLVQTAMPSSLRETMIMLEGRIDTTALDFSNASFQMFLSLVVPFQVGGVWRKKGKR